MNSPLANWNKELKIMTVYLRVFGLAVDEDGNKNYAGVKLILILMKLQMRKR